MLGATSTVTVTVCVSWAEQPPPFVAMTLNVVWTSARAGRQIDRAARAAHRRAHRRRASVELVTDSDLRSRDGYIATGAAAHGGAARRAHCEVQRHAAAVLGRGRVARLPVSPSRSPLPFWLVSVQPASARNIAVALSPRRAPVPAPLLHSSSRRFHSRLSPRWLARSGRCPSAPQCWQQARLSPPRRPYSTNPSRLGREGLRPYSRKTPERVVLPGVQSNRHQVLTAKCFR